jgi:thiosulfate/3-mercaptopyruvate sulfurtransferase
MAEDAFRSPYLISTDTLTERLGAPALRIFDCSTRLMPEGDGVIRVEPCHAEHEAAHIPGAGYLDLQGRLSDLSSPWRYMMPAPDALARAFGEAGVGKDADVVLYDAGGMMWATRIWWMLRAIGFERAAVLDGGLKKWRLEGRPIASGPSAYAPAPPFSARPRPGLFCGKEDVVGAMAAPGNSLVNALTTEQFRGGGIHYGRPGRIPGSLSVPARELTDPATGALKPLSVLEAKFAEAGVDLDNPVLCYCGGGIAATLDAFVLTLLGAERVTVYDASLSEWARDPALPMVTD